MSQHKSTLRKSFRSALANKKVADQVIDSLASMQTQLNVALAKLNADAAAPTPAVAATASMAMTTPIVLTSVATGIARNTNTFTSIVSAAAANPTDTVLATFAGTAAAISCTIVPNDGTNNPANAQATAALATTNPIHLTNVAKGTARNTNTFTTQVIVASANPTDTVLVDFAGTSAATVCTVTPNNGANNPANAAATASCATSVPIVLTSVAKGAGRNANTFTFQIEAAAANPGAKVLADFSGSAAAIVLTITPDNTGVLKTLTTAQVVELINTGAVVAQPDLTVTDASSRRILQTATGGDATPVVNAGEGDGVVGTFGGGTTVAVNFTTANLVTLINTGAVGGINVTLTDGGALRALQIATGGGANNMVVAGEGNNVLGTFSGGTQVAVNLTTAQLRELIQTGLVAGKVITLSDVSGLRALQTAAGGGGAALAHSGEGDGVAGTFGGGANAIAGLDTDYVAACAIASPFSADAVISGAANKASIRRVMRSSLAKKKLADDYIDALAAIDAQFNILLAKLDAEAGTLNDGNYAALLTLSAIDPDAAHYGQNKASMRKALRSAMAHKKLADQLLDNLVAAQAAFNAVLPLLDAATIHGSCAALEVSVLDPDSY